MLKRFYSQAGQDLWVINNVFGWMSGGYFLDIGAAEGIELSNTYALEKNFGWTGLCIEADPQSFSKLKLNRDCTVINRCVAGKSGQVNFAPRTTFYGGIVENESIAGPESQILEAKTLREIFSEEKVPTTIHYLSLDVEGAEEDIMSSFPYDTHRFLAATIERPSEILRASLEAAGYLLVAEHPGLDAFYIHSSLGDSYRIRAIEAASLRTLKPFERTVKKLNRAIKQGLRKTIQKL